jgi:hypothetical protein
MVIPLKLPLPKSTISAHPLPAFATADLKTLAPWPVANHLVAVAVVGFETPLTFMMSVAPTPLTFRMSAAATPSILVYVLI